MTNLRNIYPVLQTLIIHLYLGTLFKIGFLHCSASKNVTEKEGFKVTLPYNYSHHLPPVKFKTTDGDQTIEPAVVYCTVVPKFLTKISMKNMNFDVDLIVMMEWSDHRVYVTKDLKLSDFDIILSKDMIRNLWCPKLSFENCVGSYCSLITPGKDGPAGEITFGRLWKFKGMGFKIAYRKVMRYTCDFKFASYPFDVQHCAIYLSAKYKPDEPMKTIIHTAEANQSIQVPPGYRLISFQLEKCPNDTQYQYFIECTAFVFKLSRVFSQHLMLIFLPSILIVILSWLAFWLDVENAAPRIALGLTTLLTLATQFGTAQKNLPPVEEIKALDIWMFTCMFTVFASLMEFGVAHYCRRSNNPFKIERVGPMPRNKETPAEHRRIKKARQFFEKMKLVSKCCYHKTSRHSPSRIDYVARIAFPVSFFVFNIIFWHEFYPRN